MSRKIAREELMKLMYQMDINNEYSDNVLNHYIASKNLREDEIIYIKEAISIIVEKKESIDELIKKYSAGWSINRIAKIDLALLRIALYEIYNREDIPVKVSINEALEISKKYSSEESYKFINGLLGSAVRDDQQDK